MRDDTVRLGDMLATIVRIDRYASLGRLRFDEDELVQVYFLHQLLILGEAASRVSRELREAHPDIPWGQMIGLRNVLVHGYFAVEPDIVWQVVETELPALKQKLEQILSERP
jgi:uncharacterized protein with HEPN domain